MKLHLLYTIPLVSLTPFAQGQFEPMIIDGQTPFNWTVGHRGEWCSPPQFKWKGRGAKLMADCEILKDEMKVLVNEIAERTECIKSVFLIINGEPMPTWESPGSSKPRWVTFDNNLSDQTKISQLPLKVTGTARNPNAGHERDFSTQFRVDATHCKEAKTSEDNDFKTPLAVSAAVFLLLLIIVVTATAVICRKKNHRRMKQGSTDLNDTYGTYARGWDG